MKKKHSYSILLTKYFSGNCSPSEKERVENLYREEPEFRMLFDDYKKVWQLSEKKTGFPEPDVESNWQELTRRIEYAEKVLPVVAEKQHKTKRIVTVFSRIAAVFLIAAGFYYLFTRTDTKTDWNNYASDEVSKSPLVLPDWSKVFTSYNTLIKYPGQFNKEQRLVKFSGEALFRVAHNPAKPFVVETGNVRVKVLGTVFDLRNYERENKIEVYLKEGKILFYSVDKNENILEQIILHPGEKGIYDKTTGSITRSTFGNDNFIAWKTGKLVFVNTPLNEVFPTLEHTYGVKIVPQKSCAGLRLTAKFTGESVQSVFEALNTVFGIRYEIKGKTVYVY